MVAIRNIVPQNDYFNNAITYSDFDYWKCNDLLADSRQHFYIKEIGFFDSYEQAKKYSGNFTRVDLTSPETAARTVVLDNDISSGLFGVHTFAPEEKALSLLRSESTGELAEFGSRAKFSLRMKDKSVLSPTQSSIVVVYKTNITEKILLKMSNLQGHTITLSHDISVSKDRYVRTEPINIKVFSNPIQDYFGRLRKRWKWDTLASICTLIYIAPPDESGLHYHSHFEIMQVTHGTVNVSVETKRFLGEKFTLNCGDMMIVLPEYQHNVSCGSERAVVRSIKFLPEVLYPPTTSLSQVRQYVSMFQRSLDKNPYFTKEEIEQYGIDTLIKNTVQCLDKRTLAYEIAVQSYIMNLFATLLENYCSEEKKNGDVYSALTAPFEKAISTAKMNLYDFTTADAAKVANLSYNYFCSNFKRYYGQSFSRYLESLRLRESERLLLTTDMSITEIAMTMGFSGTSHFIKKFRDAYSVTPLVFRSNARRHSKDEQ